MRQLPNGRRSGRAMRTPNGEAKSILVHSDTPGAVEIARIVREVIEQGGGTIVPFTELAE